MLLLQTDVHSNDAALTYTAMMGRAGFIAVAGSANLVMVLELAGVRRLVVVVQGYRLERYSAWIGQHGL